MGRAHGREDDPHAGDGRRLGSRCSTWWIRRARGSPTRSRCSPGAAARAGSSTPRCASRARSRRSACCSARRRPAAPTSRRFATWCSWSRERLDVPRLAAHGEMVIREKMTLEEMGGARMHCAVSGCGHYLAEAKDEAARRRARLPGLPAQRTGEPAPAGTPRPPCADAKRIGRHRAGDRAQAYDMLGVIDAVVDEGTSSS